MLPIPIMHSAVRAIIKLHRRSELLHLTPQVLIEFRNVSTRGLALNGLGLPLSEVDALTLDFESSFSLLPDNADIYPAWKTVVQSLGILGKQVHDARLMAVCHSHHVSQILTFNISHFVRMTAHWPAIKAIHPADV
jgi:predicted nucleic acid-binding protein